MDDKSKYVAKFLEAIALNNKKFMQLADELRSQLDVLSVKQGIDFGQYKSGTRVDFYVDAELHSDKSICWWLEICWEREQWIIEYSVLITHNQGQEKLKEFSDKLPENFDEFILQFNKSTDELIVTSSEISLTV